MCYTLPMTVLTIPKKMVKEDLVIISRKEYETLLFRAPRIVDEIPMTVSEKRALAQARKNLKEGKTLSLNEFARKMGVRSRP